MAAGRGEPAKLGSRLLTTLVVAALLITPTAGTAASVASAASPVSQLLIDPAPLGGRCGDPAGSWLNMQWSGSVRWRLNTTSIPPYLADPEAVRSAIRTAAATVATGRNDCGLPADLSARQQYSGTTTRHANVTEDGGCGQRDGHNVVSFGKLAAGLLAVTCVWWEGKHDDGRSVEADILIDDAAGTFFVSPPPNCRAQWDLEGIVTHEFGHVYGLGHVPYAEHSALTMSDALPECTTEYRGLGLGDYLTLRNRYGPA